MTTPKSGVRAGLRIEFYLSDPDDIEELQLLAKRSGLTVGQMARLLMLAQSWVAEMPGDREASQRRLDRVKGRPG